MGAAGVLPEGNSGEAGRSYALMADTFEAAGKRARAIELYELAVELLERVPSRYLIEAYSRLAELLELEAPQGASIRRLEEGGPGPGDVGRPLTPRSRSGDDNA